jgi:alpha-2-macroglobulin-like protein
MAAVICSFLWPFFMSAAPATSVAPVAKPLPLIRTVQPARDSVPPAGIRTAMKQASQHAQAEKCYVHLDRTLLEPGDTLWFCAYVRNANNLLPSIMSDMVWVELYNSQGYCLERKCLLALDGTAGSFLYFHSGWAGGQYTLKVFTNWMRNSKSVFERTITLQSVITPKLSLSLDFVRKSAAPGEEVSASFTAFDLENKPLAHKKVRFTVMLDGRDYKADKTNTDEYGKATIRFRLPETLSTSDGLLSAIVEHDGEIESVARAIPIVLQKVALQFFPEGGDAVVDLPTNMAFKATNELGKPADVEGVVLRNGRDTVAQLRSFHQGMGAFALTSHKEDSFAVRLHHPVRADYPLPAALPTGTTLQVARRSTDSLLVAVRSTNAHTHLYLTATLRDSVIWGQKIDFKKQNTALVSVPVTKWPIGIVRLTLFNEAQQPLAERLTFVQAHRGFRATMTFDKLSYQPREPVQLDIKVRDASDQPIAGAFSIAVTDEPLLTYADDKQGNILAALLLEQDLRGHIEEPNFYFDPKEPKAAQALDYLLMTQGWRRFVWKEVLIGQKPVYTHAPQRAEVSGSVSDSIGQLSANVPVRLLGLQAKTDANGRFTFRKINPKNQQWLELSWKAYQGSVDSFRASIDKFESNGMWMPERKNRYKLSQDKEEFGGRYVFRYRTGPAGHVTGVVWDEDIDPLGGITILLLDSSGRATSHGTVSDWAGLFEIKIPDPDLLRGRLLKLSHTGSKTLVIPIPDSINTKEVFLQIILHDKYTMLGEIEVLGYKNVERRRNMSNSTSTIIMQSMEYSMAERRRTAKQKRAGAPKASVSRKAAEPQKPARLDQKTKVLFRPQTNNKSKRGLFKRLFSRKSKSEPLPQAPADPPSPHLTLLSTNQPFFFSSLAPVREFYVPKYRKNDKDTLRQDFRSVIFWSPNVRTNAQGEATVRFCAADALTTYRATLEGLSEKGVPVHAEQKMVVGKIVSLSVQAPTHVISQDTLRLRVVVRNMQPFALPSVTLALQVPAHFVALQEKTLALSLPADTVVVVEAAYYIGDRYYYTNKVGVTLLVDGKVADEISMNIKTLHRGFPVTRSGGGIQSRTFEWRLHDPMPQTLQLHFSAPATFLDNVLACSEKMVQQPTGCFEQTASTVFPNVLALELLRKMNTLKPDVEIKAQHFAERGFQKLNRYECYKGGFSWYGGGEGNELLTAYGLLIFKEIAKVVPIDTAMVTRTQKWLLNRRDGKGAWKLSDKSNWSDIASLNSYIVWALTTSGIGARIKDEIDATYKAALNSQNPYQIALLANVMAIQKDKRYEILANWLLAHQDKDGHWESYGYSAMGSSDLCFMLETTALAALALLERAEYATASRTAIYFLMGKVSPYGYGSTQSTVLTLKALAEYANKYEPLFPPADATMTISVNGQTISNIALADKKGHVSLDLAKYVKSNDIELKVAFSHPEHTIFYNVYLDYTSRQPDNSTNVLHLQTQLHQTQVNLGQTVRLETIVENKTTGLLASSMAIVGLPAGLSVDPWQLKRLVEKQYCAFYELFDGRIVFHFQNLAPGERRVIPLDLRATIAGTFEAPASRAFLYYSNDQQVWSKPERITIRGR